MRVCRGLAFAICALLTAFLSTRALAQVPADSASLARAAADSLARRTPRPPPRASWLDDRRAIRPGDLLRIVVDEQTRASERVSTVASGRRGQKATLNAGIGEDVRVGPAKTFGAGMESDSRDIGEAGRAGGLSSVLTVRVVEYDAAGLLRIAGSKQVTVDGRTQEVTLAGMIRPEDVRGDNTLESSRILDAVITYKGKKIGPRTGILGSILSILWP